MHNQNSIHSKVHGKIAAKPEVDIAVTPGLSRSLPPLTTVPILKLLKTYLHHPPFPALCAQLRHKVSDADGRGRLGKNFLWFYLRVSSPG